MSGRIAVVGGGAAGMMAAIQAAGAGAHVAVYERNDRVGKKILSTGNGKCNFSNEIMDAGCYYGSGASRVEKIYAGFGVEETKDFFRQLGMRIKCKNGYLYPASEQAATVLDILRYEMERLGITVRTGCRVTGIGSQKDLLTVEAEKNGKSTYDAIILACGGKAAPKTGSDGAGLVMAERMGHRIVPMVPALTALRCEENFFRQVAGVRCDARLTLYIDEKIISTVRGELQLTDYGISGIPVFQFSRNAAYALQQQKCTVVGIDFMPDDADNEKEAFWTERWEKQKQQTMEQFVTGIVNKKVGLLLLKLSGIKETERANDVLIERRKKLEQLFSSLKVKIKGTNSYDQAQVCAGGVDFREVSDDLESVRTPGLFFAGEMLDIDGICGGYNLQWAWSSGAVVGRAAAQAVSRIR